MSVKHFFVIGLSFFVLVTLPGYLCSQELPSYQIRQSERDVELRGLAIGRALELEKMAKNMPKGSRAQVHLYEKAAREFFLARQWQRASGAVETAIDLAGIEKIATESILIAGESMDRLGRHTRAADHIENARQMALRRSEKSLVRKAEVRQALVNRKSSSAERAHYLKESDPGVVWTEKKKPVMHKPLGGN